MINIKSYTPADSSCLLDFFGETEKDFFPPLSQREGGVDGFLQEWELAAGSAVIARACNPRILGSMGWANAGDCYSIDWISVLNDLRGTGLAQDIVRYSLTQMPRLENGAAFARTWDTNKKSRGLMEGLGALQITREDVPQAIKRLFSLREFPGRKTVWYKLEPAEVYRRLELRE
jgi:hypothetical protein